MSNRLKSFRGPSTPSPSPVQHPQGKGQITPSSPSRQIESTFHRKTRTLLQELRSTSETWDDLVLLDGLKSATQLVDTRTELENSLKMIPNGLPRTHLVRPQLAIMDNCIEKLDAVIRKLRKQFQKMNTIMDNLDALLIEAHKTRGCKWAQEEPLWVTWSLERFVTQIGAILRPYHRSLHFHIELVDKLRSHDVSFEDSRDIINQWTQQSWLAEDGWSAAWEDLCEVEVEKW
ncbi:hypothetical protein CPB83DRAFT_847686 [Crepidotus variabilis]|uniref:Uncharacterized protein n=1 Tax=Crepidotus variabilis TaxID=179855 RepID=A0A9P6ENY2_9AGAR|nr:hypothetical protein CPB83DRAFT_847686 [Crepidotus variabilis]